MFFPTNNTPRWIIFSIDIFICIFSVILAFLVRFNFAIPDQYIQLLKLNLVVIVGIRALSFIVTKTYAGIIRHTDTKDAQRIFLIVTSGSILFFFFNIYTYNFVDGEFKIPFSILIIDYMTSMFLMITFRVAVKILYYELKNPNREKRDVIIYGAGEAGLTAKRAIDRDAGTKYNVLAFIDDNANKASKKLEGVTIYQTSNLSELLNKNAVAHLIISIQNLDVSRKKEVIEICLANNTKVLNVPPVTSWINGELSFKQIKKINVEELLGRDTIKLDEKNIKQQIAGKIILITGAAGSIGSELVRQISKYQPKKMILVDQAESPLYELELEIKEKFNAPNFEVVVGDVRNKERMENVFRTFHPDLVYHAAAYKHVPMMENNPSEAILTNVLGTKILADLAVEFKATQFVMVSTDKAVNPTNVMGASKRIAEIYVQSLNTISNVKFVTTRFGNVLGSNGSVIPLFKKQIDTGGPVTLTHPEITRYFMTIPEACQLVLEAGTMGKGGEIFIFDMGKSVKIIDLAKKMITLSGLQLGKDIQIVFTGLRPGEKLYEELLNDKENTLPTHHPQIMIAKVAEYNFEIISKKIETLIHLFAQQNNIEIVTKMKEIVPEFISNNSVFMELDKDKSPELIGTN